MPESLRLPGRTSHPLPPTLVVTSPRDEVSSRPTLARPRRKTVGSESKTGKKEWIDVDSGQTSPRRKKRAVQSKSSSSKGRSRSNTESSFFPKLARILESGESNLTRRSETRGQQSRHRRESKSTHSRRSHHERSDSSNHKRSPVKQHRVGSLHRRSETFPRLINPSLLSVLSSLTRISDHSSGSGTTITQDSYDRQSQRGGRGRPQREASQASVREINTKTVHVPNVFDYLDATMDEYGDSHSIRSSSSSSSAASHYQHSDAGSSELPDTPSSHSTFPSPTATRNGSISGSVAELRRKYDAQYATSLDSRRSGSRSPEAERSSPRNGKKLPQLRDVAESDERDSHTSAIVEDAVREGRQRNASLSYAARLPTPPDSHEDRLKVQQDALRQHVAQEHHPSAHHRVDSAYGQHRSYSSSSMRSTDSQRAWAQYMHDMQMQQYQYASPAITMAYPVPQHGVNGYVAQAAPPPAPDAPDNAQQTIAGYEMLARELSNEQSAVKPIYRRFEYLNHRILLHMQDELQEMEEQLRRVDEIIATLEPPVPAGEGGQSPSPPPASRRSDKNYGSQWHHQRTELLGRIFLKTKDYNAAVASFANLTKDSAPAEKEEIATYRDWLAAKTPIHEVETRFLADEHEKDLIVPGTPPPSFSASSGRRSRRSSAATQGSDFPAQADRQPLLALAFLPILPLLLFNMIPTFSGRLFATILITTAAVLVAATTKIGDAMSNREWCVCAAAYMLVSIGIAGCVPQQH